ncbi:hypothetical protein IC229_33885 [Spirosoma sp. BT702]|uniref:Ig-like domain-containing protein n=1 Tax=Spirosoma profusum TaxID=2771354 RepID=A0A927AWA5_9BACT|nr:DUF6443 domain-containing protein [Spirosoma profusum]MBD2705648.1 hypothetical protein [Spirosoma profusum]
MSSSTPPVNGTPSVTTLTISGVPSVTAATAKTLYNEGESLTLTAGVSASVVGTIQYRWSGPNSFTSALQNPIQATATPAMSGSYSVVTTNVAGCTAMAQVSLTVSPTSFSCTCQDCDQPEVRDTDNPTGAAQATAGQNYVQESVQLNEAGTQAVHTLTYLDGLGRPIQQVSVGTGGKTTAVPQADVIQLREYDGFGREATQYLPYAKASNGGAYRSDGASAVSGYHNGTLSRSNSPTTTFNFEASPLNRVISLQLPGRTSAQTLVYRTNTASELKLLTFNFADKTITVSTYAAGQLYVTETTDENGQKTTEYKDKEGRVVGKDVAGRKTLYGYDDFGQLRCVVPPKASGSLSGSFNPVTTTNDLLFGYDYDERGLLIQKKIPGAGVSSLTYDSRDRLWKATDAKNQTVVTTYDNLDRVVSTSLAGGQVLTKTFYDTYGYGEQGFDVSHAFGQARLTGQLQGMVTGNWSSLLGEGTATAGLTATLVSSTYYDELGRVIQTVSDNHKGGKDRSSSRLDFIGRSLEQKLSTTGNSSLEVVVETRTAYDAGSRVKSVCQRVSDNVQAPIGNGILAYLEPVARHQYNGIGELTTKTLGCEIQTLNYDYKMQGWLARINDPANLNAGFKPADKHFFGMQLAYDGVGNIITWDYRNAQTSYGPPYDLNQRPAYGYSFTYDALNRLKSGGLTQQGQAVFSLSNLAYDDNGNLDALTRTLQGAVVDDLRYSYSATSNKLSSVSDVGTNPAGGNAFVKDGTATYTYDANGNLSSDSGKELSAISYNHLNLPKTVTQQSGQAIHYVYSASGQKLRAIFPGVGGGQPKTYDYVAGLVYAGNQLEFIPTAEGRVLPPGLASTTVVLGTSNTVVATNQFYRYEYHLKDHLGNLRVACRCGEKAVAQTPSDSYIPLVVQEQHYDPFGLDLSSLSTKPGLNANRFKYNGKEEQPGIGWIDYGARMYDPQVPRWLSVDPLSELDFHQSGYMYVSGNPINRIDLFGLTDTTYVVKPGTKSNILDAVTVRAKHNNPLNNSIAENWEIAHIRNRRQYGENSPYQKHFRAGGNEAAVIIGAPIAAIGMVEAGVAWSSLSRLEQLDKLAAVKRFYSLPAITSRLSVNLIGQALGNHLSKGQNKIELISIGADFLLPSYVGLGISSVYEYSGNSEGFEFNRQKNGDIAAKLASGIVFGAAGDKISDWVSPNGGVTLMGTIFDATLETWHQTFDAIMESGKKKP